MNRKISVLQVAMTIIALTMLLGCSQNSFKSSGPPPKAPDHPKAAQPFVEGHASEAPAPPPKPQSVDRSEVNWKAEGTIILPPAFQTNFKPGSTIYVIARTATGKSHTVAAKKIRPDKFPVTFELTNRDSMTGEGLPEDLLVEAWLDRDGSISTREKGDLFTRPVGVKNGDTFTLTLDQEIK